MVKLLKTIESRTLFGVKAALRLSCLAVSTAVLAASATITLVVDAPTKYVDGSAITVPLDFDLYGASCTDSRPFPHLAGPQRTVTFPPRTPAAGKKHCYYATATDTVSKITSDPSPDFVVDLTVVTPPPPPPPAVKPAPPNLKVSP